MNFNQLSEQLLLQVKKEESTDQIRGALLATGLSELRASLQTDGQKKAFWINIYNAFFQILRREQAIGKPTVYREKLVPIAGRNFSLDDIEHGILRKYRLKWALGYLPDPFAPAVIKQLALRKMDYRIHFALNCGAKSCPPIAFYTVDKIDRQLDLATQSFLEAETEVLSDQKQVGITRLFQWYLGDFGGRRGIRRILREQLQLETAGTKLFFRDYNWQEALANFRELV